jgi:hypothetical protein
MTGGQKIGQMGRVFQAALWFEVEDFAIHIQTRASV